jgi:hypothetical protein
MRLRFFVHEAAPWEHWSTRIVTNSFARGEELNQQLYAGYDTREDPDVEILPYGGNYCWYF